MNAWMRNAWPSTWPTLAIMFGASVWGVIWFPLRHLAALGVSGTASSAMTSAAGCLFVLIARRGAIRTIRWHWLLAALGLAAGITNLGFVWGAIHGQVMRVLLLFYLTPAWTALFAHFILHERLTWPGAGLAMLSLGGAMTMLWSPQLGLPVPGSLAEWAGLMGGMGFAMSNVLILKTSRVLPQMRPEMRTAVIFGGAALFSACAACFEPMPAPPAGTHLMTAAALVLGLGFLLASNNMLVQFGLARIPANRASIIMLFELVVTALSAWLLAGEAPGPREWAGGACIVVASALSSWVHRDKPLPEGPAAAAPVASVTTTADDEPPSAANATDDQPDEHDDPPADNGDAPRKTSPIHTPGKKDSPRAMV